jgi:very-short-patch-repair endonuclease
MKKDSKMTEEQRQRNIEAQKKAWANPELRKKHSLVHLGQKAWNEGIKNPYSLEQLKRLSEAHKGQVAWNKGKHPSPETLRKLSESHKGQISWNKGKHTPEETKVKQSESKKKIIEKIRENTLKQYESGSFPKQENTKPEKQITEELLKRGYKEGIDFIHQYKFVNKFMCDFCFPQKKVIIEAYGDYWHCNPKIYSIPKNSQQIKFLNKDKSKEAYIRKVDNGSWTLLIFWESDIKKDVGKCVDEVEKILKKKMIF